MIDVRADIAAYLEAQGIGTRGTDIFVTTIPAEYSDAIMLVIENTEDQSPDYDWRSVMIGVYCRNTSEQNGAAKMEAVYNAMARLANKTLGNTSLKFCSATSIQSLPLDVANRHQFRMSLHVQYVPASEAN